MLLAMRSSVGPVFLGIFVVWQLLFIAVDNVLSVFPRGQPTITYRHEGSTAFSEIVVPARDLGARLLAPSNRWAELTGQYQGWTLFAPEVPTQSAFPVVELAWENRRVSLRSESEPVDPRHYFHPPGYASRLFNYQWRLAGALWSWNEESFALEPERWQGFIESQIRQQWRPMRAYLKFRAERFLKKSGEPTPRSITLSVRLYATVPSGEPGIWHDPVEQPLARWLPGEKESAKYLPIEMYDPITKRFEKLLTGL